MTFYLFKKTKFSDLKQRSEFTAKLYQIFLKITKKIGSSLSRTVYL